MLKQHIGKTIGLFVSQLVLLPEIMAMNGTIDLTQLHGTELYVVIGFYVFQTIIGIYFGNRYDRKACVKDLIYQLKSKDFAASTFEKIAALVDRDPDSRLTIYLLQTEKDSHPQQQTFRSLCVKFQPTQMEMATHAIAASNNTPINDGTGHFLSFVAFLPVFASSSPLFFPLCRERKQQCTKMYIDVV